MARGIVNFFNVDKGLGFIEPETGGQDIVVHLAALQVAGITQLRRGQKVRYDKSIDQVGQPCAINIIRIADEERV